MKSALPSHADLAFSSNTVSTRSSLPATTHSSSLSTAQSISEIDIVLPVLPVMATAILCVWATHTTVVSPEVAASTAEPPEVVAPTLIPKVFSETTPVPKSVPELTPALESVLEPAQFQSLVPVPDSAPAPPKAAAALFPELRDVSSHL